MFGGHTNAVRCLPFVLPAHMAEYIQRRPIEFSILRAAEHGSTCRLSAAESSETIPTGDFRIFPIIDIISGPFSDGPGLSILARAGLADVVGCALSARVSSRWSAMCANSRAITAHRTQHKYWLMRNKSVVQRSERNIIESNDPQRITKNRRADCCTMRTMS